jgi:hypothetical protein
MFAKLLKICKAVKLFESVLKTFQKLSKLIENVLKKHF